MDVVRRRRRVVLSWPISVTPADGTPVAQPIAMAKPRRKDNGAPHNAADIIAAAIDRDRLAQRAYELYLARGGSDGQDMEDWLNAERELREIRPPNPGPNPEH
jgi:hypothetical protein